LARIENYKFTIEEAFRECFYIVPDYQREYVWTEKEVQQLLSDIDEQFDGPENLEYFIGTILVSPTDRKGHYEVIDGQQRLTTFFLLLCALRTKLRGEAVRQVLEDLLSSRYSDRDGEAHLALKLDPRYESAGDVVRKIVDVDGSPEAVRAAIQSSGIAAFGSLDNLIAAYNTIYRHLEDNYQDVAQLKKFWGHVAYNVVFIQISADIGNALKIFETINERGVGLNPMDLLKNLLFTQVPQQRFTELKNEWKKVTSPLDKAGEKPLRFLRYYLMASYPVASSGDAIIREDQIYDWFLDPANARAADYKTQPFEFVRHLVRATERYMWFIDGRGADGQPSTAMARLKLLTGGGFSLHYILLLAAAGLPIPLFDHFVGQLEAFLFSYIFTKTPTKELERAFSVWADELRAIARLDPAEQSAELDAFVQNRFALGIAAKAPELRDALRRYSMHSMQKYRTKYMLVCLTEHVEMAFNGTRRRGDLAAFMPLEIEHVLPDTPSGELRSAWAIENPGLDYDDYKQRLGNFILLEKPINIVAGNDFFDQKRALYAQCGTYLGRSLVGLSEVGVNSSVTRMNEKLRPFDSWNAEAIDSRQEMLAALVTEVWKTEDLAAA
jgi:hypothetical protein